MIRTAFILDKTKISLGRLGEEQNDVAYWVSRPADERFAAIELMRQVNYAYDPITDRIPRLLEVVEGTRR